MSLPFYLLHSFLALGVLKLRDSITYGIRSVMCTVVAVSRRGDGESGVLLGGQYSG